MSMELTDDQVRQAVYERLRAERERRRQAVMKEAIRLLYSRENSKKTGAEIVQILKDKIGKDMVEEILDDLAAEDTGNWLEKIRPQ